MFRIAILTVLVFSMGAMAGGSASGSSDQPANQPVVSCFGSDCTESQQGAAWIGSVINPALFGLAALTVVGKVSKPGTGMDAKTGFWAFAAVGSLAWGTYALYAEDATTAWANYGVGVGVPVLTGMAYGLRSLCKQADETNGLLRQPLNGVRSSI